MKRSHIAFALALSWPALAGARDGVLSGPLLGYALEEGGALRPIHGIPGAALVGPPVPLGFAAAAAELSPSQDYVLAISAEDGLPRVVDLAGGAPAVRLLEGIEPSADRIVLSPRGRAALLFQSGGPGARIVTGLPSAPVARPIDLSALPGAPGALAVSDDGAAVLAASPAGLFLLTAAGEIRPLPAAGPVTALAFFPGSRDALAAGAGFAGLLSDVSGEPAWRTLATLAEDFGEPLAVASAAPRALVAAGNAVAAIDLASGELSALPCACRVTTLARLGGDAFRITPASASPVWIVSAGPEARLLFVPPATAEEEVR